MFNILNPRKRRAPKGGLVLIDTKRTATAIHNKPARPFAIDIYTHVNAGKRYPYASKRQINRRAQSLAEELWDAHKSKAA